MGRGPPGGYEAAIPAPPGAITRTLGGSCRSGAAARERGAARGPAGVRRATRGRG